jgi:hypothetical protein
MSVLVDTNVLLRRIQPDHMHHALTIDSAASGCKATAMDVLLFRSKYVVEISNPWKRDRRCLHGG